jgi:hypothetical protein
MRPNTYPHSVRATLTVPRILPLLALRMTASLGRNDQGQAVAGSPVPTLTALVLHSSVRRSP